MNRRVVVLPHGDLGEELQTLFDEFAADSVYVLAAAGPPEWGLDDRNVAMLPAETLRQVDGRLKTIGPVDVIIDLLGDRNSDAETRWRALFFHLRAGGVYLLANPGGPRSARRPGASSFAELFLRRHWGSDTGGESLPPAEQELLDSCGRFLMDSSSLLIEKRQRHYVKLREADVGRLLPQRNTRDTVVTLGKLGKGELACHGAVVHHQVTVPITNMGLVLPYPELYVQHYTGKLGLIGNSLLVGDSTVLPASFHHPTAQNLGNPRLIGDHVNFARVPHHLRPTRTLPGHYYHLDCWSPGHFGHVMTEVVARLWGWPIAKAEFPDLKAIFRRRYPNERHPELELALFTAFGIDRSDIVWVDEPVWLTSVVTASQMWQNFTPLFVHPQIVQTWDRMRAGAVVKRADRPPCIFVSRRPSLKGRSCRNAAAVEAFFARHGFAVVFPEELDLAEQAAVFGNAKVVAGFAGSGLFNILYAGDLTTLIVLSHEGYTARNEHLYTMALGCTTHYFWSTPDVPPPPGGWSPASYISAWEFDFDRNGQELEQLLKTVDG